MCIYPLLIDIFRIYRVLKHLFKVLERDKSVDDYSPRRKLFPCRKHCNNSYSVQIPYNILDMVANMSDPD